MNARVDHSNLHRTAKLFMDNGRAQSHEEALALLQSFGLSVLVNGEAARTRPAQIALLTLVNLARRTLLGGVEVAGIGDAPLLVPLAPEGSLADAVRTLGGRVVASASGRWPVAAIGGSAPAASALPSWRLTWEGWRGGVVPCRDGQRLAEDEVLPLAPAMAAAACAAEAFFFHSGDHPLAGKRSAGLSLWHPGADWLAADAAEPKLAYLPSRLWLIGLGNLGQAYSWLLACLPYARPADVTLVLQDFDRMGESNDSTSLLATRKAVEWMKTRWVANWLEARGFTTLLEERRFGEWTRRHTSEPGVALCGVDNALARAALEKAGFDLVIEAGLGAGPQSFRNFSVHRFPGARRADQIWSAANETGERDLTDLPAYEELRKRGMDSCGLAQLASRTVGVPFVGLIAGGFAISELLRQLHGGAVCDVISGSMAVLSDIEAVVQETHAPYAFGHVEVAP